MIITVNKDIDRYQESIALGLSVKQLVFSTASLVSGAGLVLLLYRYIGLTASAYIAIPVVAPIAMGGFYSFNGMSFYEVMGRKFLFTFRNQALVYVSTEGEQTLREFEQKVDTSGKKPGMFKSKKVDLPDEPLSKTVNNRQEEFEAMKKKTIKMAVGCGMTIIVLVVITVLLKVIG
jgi:hypothetical protein